jgi:hypothetical protein
MLTFSYNDLNLHYTVCFFSKNEILEHLVYFNGAKKEKSNNRGTVPPFSISHSIFYDATT